MRELGCWRWLARVSPNGYGQFSIKAGDTRMAHRVAYELTVGPIPEKHILDHLCRRRDCVRPSHLEPVLQRINVLRGALSHDLTGKCRNGHDVTAPGAVRPRRDGSRRCIKCESNNRRLRRQAGEQTE